MSNPVVTVTDRNNDSDTVLAVVRRYHEQTKHRLDAYARGPDTIDWEAQPDPFRRFQGCNHTPLPLTAYTLTAPYPVLYQADAVTPHALNLDGIAMLLELSLGLSAWKQYGTARWSLRINPSSGNLHPTETYMIINHTDELAPGIYHYQVHDHMLEQRCAFDTSPAAGSGNFLLGLSSVHWREAWKYGERAYRYCQLDTGHAIAAVNFAATLLGWKVKLLSALPDKDVAALMGIDRDQDFNECEYEHPDVLLCIYADTDGNPDIPELLSLACQGSWSGVANVLDSRHLYAWPVIDEVSSAAQKPATELHQAEVIPLPALHTVPCEETAVAVIKHRRSAQAFDGVTAMSRDSFYSMLDKLLPRHDIAPWNTWSRTFIHPVLFVHRVEGLPRGVYALPRHQAARETMQQAMRDEFQWGRPDDCPVHLPLYHLISANTGNAAATVSCHQAIATDSAFSLGMLAEYDRALAGGTWGYRYLHWEAGILGQVLYLEAEAAGLRGTGIGCFFDDTFHDMLGLVDTTFQDVYHFTVGGPVVDHRLTTLTPYGHLPRET